MVQKNSLIVLAVRLNGNNMNVNNLNNQGLLIKTKNFLKTNLKFIISIFIIFFLIFISFQFFNFYNLNKIHKNSVSFFNAQNLENINSIQKPMIELSKKKNFYSILSKLELIEISIKNKNFKNSIILYNELLNDKKLNNIYLSAIASKAAYNFIDINFTESSKDYISNIENFISFIDNDLINYQGIKMELNYLVKLLKTKKNNVEYRKFDEAIDLYKNILNSDVVSSTIKERVTKIHEFHL